MGNKTVRVSCGGTHVSWAQAYKAYVGGVSPRYGIEQIHEALAKANNTC